MWPQLTLLALIVMALTINLIKHGGTKKYNFWGALVGVAIQLFLLWAGGFFEVFIRN